MLYNIENKNVIVTVEEEYQLPEDLKTAIMQHWNNVLTGGANVWNGDVLCVADIKIDENEVTLICKKSDYAHYLYEERIGCKDGYKCRNLSAGCMLETSDGYLVFGELANNMSFPHVLQTTGGGIDKGDIKDGKIDVLNTIRREAKEELGIDLDDRSSIKFNKLKYLYVSEPGEQPGVQIFTKSVSNKTAQELQSHFIQYNAYLAKNGLEQEFERLHFIKKETAVRDMGKLSNPKRIYINSILKLEEEEIKKEEIEAR